MSKKAQGIAFAIFCIVILVAVIGLVYILNLEPTITGRGHDPTIFYSEPGETLEEYKQRMRLQELMIQHTRPRPGPYDIYPAQDPPGVVTQVSTGSTIDESKVGAGYKGFYD